jgi:short-subunit dehydrogenase
VELAGARALVTGASRGIGRATAVALARAGAAVKVTGRDQAALEAVARAIRGEHLAADLARPEEVDRLAAWAGEVDVLVNNAGVGWAGRFVDMPLDRVEEVVRVNLLAAIRLTRALLPGMVARGRGHVVNVASIAGHVGPREEAVYVATKAGLIGFSESLRHELAGTGVGVSVVSPGVVRTAFFEREGRPYTRRLPRMAEPEVVARAVVRAVREERAEVFAPRWYAFPAWLRGAAPGLYRWLQARFG